MVKLNRGPLGTAPVSTGKTHEGGPGFERDPKAELFLRATTMFAGEDSFYEAARSHDERSVELAKKIAAQDWDWITGFLPWLRASGNIRTMPIMLAAHVVHESLETHAAKGPITDTSQVVGRSWGNQMSNRTLISSVLQRPDELKEMAQYWTRTFGAMPKPVKRGIADAASRMLTQRNVLRWDKPGPMMFADVVELTHPKKRVISTEEGLLEDSIQGRLFEHLITTRHNREGYVPPAALGQIRARWDLSRMEPAQRHRLAESALHGEVEDRRKITAAAAGQWEWVLSWLGEYKDESKALSKREQWELAAPEIGYMGLIRNLRNLDEAGIKESLADKLVRRIADPGEVVRSRQLPFRFLSAYLNAPSVRWANALEKALDHCIPNIPVLDGRTLILIDTSGSMLGPLGGSKARGKRTSVSRSPSMMQAAALFGLALALKNNSNVDVWGFANGRFVVDPKPLASTGLLQAVTAFTMQAGKVGYGTEIGKTVRATYHGHDRVVIFTDMQTFPDDKEDYYASTVRGTGDVTSAVPANVHVFGFNLSGYTHSAMASGSAYRHELGGLTDHTFRLIPVLEMGAAGKWPWEATGVPFAVDDDE